MKTRGLTLVEVAVALMILATLMMAYFTLTQSTVHSVGQSRNYVLASQAAENAIEVILSHRYGTPLPSERLRFSPDIVIEGRSTSTNFEVEVSPVVEAGGNGSFFGDSMEDYDVLKVVVTWREPEPSGGGTRRQSLDFQLVVRRQYDL